MLACCRSPRWASGSIATPPTKVRALLPSPGIWLDPHLHLRDGQKRGQHNLSAECLAGVSDTAIEKTAISASPYFRKQVKWQNCFSTQSSCTQFKSNAYPCLAKSMKIQTVNCDYGSVGVGYGYMWDRKTIHCLQKQASRQWLVVIWALHSLRWDNNPGCFQNTNTRSLIFPFGSNAAMQFFRSIGVVCVDKLPFFFRRLCAYFMLFVQISANMLPILFKNRKINHLFMWRYLWYDASSYPEHAFMNIVVVVVEHRCINLTRFYSIPSAITLRTILLWDLV